MKLSQPRQWNEVSIDHPDKNRVNFDAHTKTIFLRPACKNWVNVDHHPHKEQVSRSLHSKEVNFGRHTVNVEPPHQEQVTFDPNTKTKSNSISDTKIKVVSAPVLKPSQFDPHSKVMSTSMPRYKTVWISIHTLRLRFFWPPRKSQANSNPYTEVKSILIPTINSVSYTHLTLPTKA